MYNLGMIENLYPPVFDHKFLHSEYRITLLSSTQTYYWHCLKLYYYNFNFDGMLFGLLMNMIVVYPPWRRSTTETRMIERRNAADEIRPAEYANSALNKKETHNIVSGATGKRERGGTEEEK